MKDRRKTFPVLDSVVVERDVLNVADTEPMNRGDRSQTVPVPDSGVVERDVLNVEDTEPGNRSDPRQTVPVPVRVVERDVRYVEDTGTVGTTDVLLNVKGDPLNELD